MKKVLLLILGMCQAAFVYGQDIIGNTIELEFENIVSDNGKMMVGLYSSEETWLKKTAMSKLGTIKNGKSTVVFENVPNGVYAVSSYHDENDNNELDSNFFGIPKENTGSSNNAPARMGPPRWEDAKFELNGKSIKQTIKM